MPDRALRFTEAATQDLGDIWDYTAATWSPQQAETYLTGLRRTIQTLQEMPEIARERREFTPPVRVHPSASHLIVFVADEQTLIVLRILHARQNWQSYLADL